MGGEAFSYRTTKDRVVRIFWEGRCVRALGGNRGEALSAELAAADDKQRRRSCSGRPATSGGATSAAAGGRDGSLGTRASANIYPVRYRSKS